MMKTPTLAIAILMSGAAVAQTYTTTEPDVDVDAHVGVQPDGDVDVDADVDLGTETESHVMAHSAMPASGRLVMPGNTNPERDERGIPVISDPAVVPAGFNGVAGTAMGGPLVDPVTGETIEAADDTYPACTAKVTDNCLQAYEVGSAD